MDNIAIIEDDLDIRKSLSAYFSKSSRISCVIAVDTVETFVKFHFGQGTNKACRNYLFKQLPVHPIIIIYYH